MALNRTDRDLVGLSVLALLLSGPKHTYEMHRMMVVTRKDFVTGLPRSMYHAVERLEKAELLVPVETVREGSRPERTVYAITDRGREEVQSRVERLLETPDADATLLTAALSFITCLPPHQAADALRTRRDVLAGRIHSVETELAEASKHVPRVLLLETEQDLVSLRSQHAWAAELVNEIETGGLTWPTDVIQLGKEAWPD